MKYLKLFEQTLSNIIGEEVTSLINRKLCEGGNIFKAAEWTKDNPIMRTVRINRENVLPTVQYLEKLTGLNLKNNLLGSTGVKPTSGDMDIAVDKNKVSKDSLISTLVKQGVDPGDIRKTGDSVHYCSPISGKDQKGHFVQVDFMFVPNVAFAVWANKTLPESQYKGVYKQKLMADLVRTINPEWKWNHFNGVLSRADNSNVFGFNPDAIAKGLLGNTAKKEDLESVEHILAKLESHPKREEIKSAYRNTIGNDLEGPQINEAKAQKVGREFQHLEDYVFVYGLPGVKKAIDVIKNIAQKSETLEVKWDGCIDPDLILKTNLGPLRIEEIIDRHQQGESIQVLAHDLDSKEDRMVNVDLSTKNYGKKAWVEIELENNDVLRLTEDHEVYTTNRGWVQAHSLTINDDIKELT